MLLIGGEAGIGKTAVLAALINQAEPDCLVMQGFCWEGSGAPPYWPWSQVLRASGLSRAQLGEAGWLLDTASESAERTAPTGSMSAAAATDAQFRLFEAVSGCLKELAVDRPLLVVIDDLHWADEPSVRLLGFLARALAGNRVLLAGAYRDTEASTGLLSLAGSAQQLMLAGLAPDDVAAMIEDIAGSETAAQVSSQLWQRSGGNPFFVRELTRLLLAQGPWREHTHIPASVAETLRRRLRGGAPPACGSSTGPRSPVGTSTPPCWSAAARPPTRPRPSACWTRPAVPVSSSVTATTRASPTTSTGKPSSTA